MLQLARRCVNGRTQAVIAASRRGLGDTFNQPECLLNGSHRNEELIRMTLKPRKFMVKIKSSGHLVQSFDHNANRCHLRCVPPTSVESIH